MAERLSLGPDVRKLRIGESFSKGGNKNFHTFRYDFKPASVDTKKMAAVEIGPSNQATVTVPHVEGAGTAHTVFKGSCKPYTKECVLIIDNLTGDIVLEKLRSNVQLKKTRAEAGSRKTQPRPLTPVDGNCVGSSVNTTKKTTNSPHQRHSPNRRSTHSPSHQRLSPLPNQPRSPTTEQQSSAPANTNRQSLSVPSMPLLFGGEQDATEAGSSEIGFLSDSSNDSSSGSSSSSSSSSSTSSGCSKNESTEKLPAAQHDISSHASNQSSGVLPSMPQFSQLTEDLHLSESGSDSDV